MKLVSKSLFKVLTNMRPLTYLSQSHEPFLRNEASARMQQIDH